MDEDPGARYVLREARELRPLVWLEAGGTFDNLLRSEWDLKPVLKLASKGFPVQGFAKHLGKRATVTGTFSSEEPVLCMQVGAIADLSDSCARDR